jgi:predicted ATPase/DNA-binding CsgD family transcriptional regulator
VAGQARSVAVVESAPLLAPAFRLPRQLTSFVGRERELAEVIRAVGEHRLVTVCGSGGAGKTRIVLAVAERVQGSHPGGVFLAELGDVRDAALVASSLAATLGVREQPDVGTIRSITDALGAARALLVLDNCGRHIEACAGLAYELLTACPGVHLLASSREPLGVPGELAWRLPPLPTPSASPADVERCESVCLFEERARTFQPAFRLTAETMPAVTRICDLTDGIPLAIELAAGRLTTLSADQIADQLGSALDVLTSGSRLLPARQRTLRATIDWSYERLAPGEKVLFNRLSVFTGLASLEAVRAVCSDAALPGVEVLDILARLIDKSLVQAEAAPHELRYRLLELLRRYAGDRLAEAGDADVLQARHAAYFAALAERSNDEEARTHYSEWSQRLADERPNLRAALTWSLAADPALALRLGASLSWFWHTFSNLAEGRGWLEQVLTLPGGEPAVRAKALHGAGQIVYRQGDCDAAQGFLSEALAIYRELEDESNVSRALRTLGLVLLSLADYRRAESCLEEALAIQRRLGDGVDSARTLGSLALVSMAAGHYEQATARLEESTRLAREYGDEWGLATGIGVRGELALEMGDADAARSHLRVSMGVLAAQNDAASVAYRLEGFARLAVLRGDHERALTLVAAGERVRARIGAVAVPHWRRRLDEQLARSRRAVTPEAAADAKAHGAAMSMEEAVAYAMNETVVEPRRARDSAQPAWASSRSREAGLSAREWDVLGLLITGVSNRVIAARLSISPNTVNKHVASILDKLRAHSRSQAIAIVLGLEQMT